MTDEIIYLMEQLLLLHKKYNNEDYVNFFSQYQFEIYYWFQFQRLSYLIQEEINEFQPFQNKEN